MPRFLFDCKDVIVLDRQFDWGRVAEFKQGQHPKFWVSRYAQDLVNLEVRILLLEYLLC